MGECALKIVSQILVQEVFFLSHVPHPTVHMAMWEGWETVKPRKEQQKNWEST
jgi:hypothetical protein